MSWPSQVDTEFCTLLDKGFPAPIQLKTEPFCLAASHRLQTFGLHAHTIVSLSSPVILVLIEPRSIRCLVRWSLTIVIDQQTSIACRHPLAVPYPPRDTPRGCPNLTQVGCPRDKVQAQRIQNGELKPQGSTGVCEQLQVLGACSAPQQDAATSGMPHTW